MSDLCTVLFFCILIILLPSALCSISNCTIMEVAKTSEENQSLAEDKHADFVYEISTRMQEKFRIEAKVCEADKFHTICTCRWVPGNNSPVCKPPANDSMCSADDSKMSFRLLVRRTHSDVIWELLPQNSTLVVLRHIKLHVTYPPQITKLAVNGHEVNGTHLVDENQEVSVSCAFLNGNPPATIRIINEKGHTLSSTKYGKAPLTVSLGVLQCDDNWPTITCEAPGWELRECVSILVRCVPRLTPRDGQSLHLSRVLEEGLTFNLKSYTDNISSCLMTKLTSDPITQEVVCEVSGREPELTLTARFASNHRIGEGSWTFHIKSELGESSTTFKLINNTSQAGVQRHSQSQEQGQAIGDV